MRSNTERSSESDGKDHKAQVRLPLHKNPQGYLKAPRDADGRPYPTA